MNYFNYALPKRLRGIDVPNCLSERAAFQNKDYKFRRASLLDIPFVFDLIQDGSEIGSFTERFMTSKGWVRLLSVLVWDVLAPHRFIACGGYDIKLLIFTLNNEDVGFMKIKFGFTDRYIYEIDLCAIAQERRNQKIGSQMIRMFIEDLPSGAEVTAYCTIYSRAMQHIFKMLKFQRDKKAIKMHADLYRFTKSSHVV